MEFYDKNQSWLPPENYKFVRVTPDGAYLKVQYGQPIFKEGTLQIVAENIIIVYANDQGREVARTWTQINVPQVFDEAPKPQPVARRFQFWNGFLITLHGIQEMLRCIGYRR